VSEPSAIFRVNADDLPWVDYEESADDSGRAQIRVKGVTYRNADVPPVQYVEYAAGYTDPVHSHDTGEFFIVTEGSLWLDDVESGPGSVVFIPRDTDYAVRAGDQGVRYYRVVTG
jgi:quercetin dioxygenase-like cupin family protein